MDISQIHRVMVCRINKRLGNHLLLTPFLQALHAIVPQAQIDLLLSQQRFAELLQPLPGIERIYTLDHGVRDVLLMRRALRQRQYDLVIDPCVTSTSGRLAALFTPARQRLGFTQRGAALVGLSHTQSPQADTPHDACRSFELFELLSPGRITANHYRLALHLSDTERAAGYAQLEQITQGDAPLRIGLFCDAAPSKKLAATWWQELLVQLQQQLPNALCIEILSVNSHRAVLPSIPSLYQPQLRALASTLTHLDYFISADSGPMHLASAAGVPTIALFNHTNPQQYAPLGQRDLSLVLTTLTVTEVAQQIKAHIEALR